MNRNTKCGSVRYALEFVKMAHLKRVEVIVIKKLKKQHEYKKLASKPIANNISHSM